MVSKSLITAIFSIAYLQAAPRQALQNHVPLAVKDSRRVGSLSPTARMDLAIGLPLRNAEEFDRFIEQVSDPQSPNFRHYLTADQFAAQFGPSQEDYDKLTTFVQASGLSVSGTHSNRMILDVSGPVSAIEKTLHVNMTVWEHATRGRFIAPDRDPWLDVDMQVLDITGLDNFVLPRPMNVKALPLTSAIPFVGGSGPSGLFLGKDFRAAYAPGVALTGAGQTVGLFELDGFFAGDVTANFKQAGLPAVPVQTVLLDGFNGSAGGANLEVILDIMMAAYVAPASNIIVYEGYNWNDVLNRMATDNLAKQLSCSWVFSPINATTEQIFKQMIAQGQSFLQASGDSGAYSGAIWPPADNPNVTVVGGTALSTTGPGGQWLSESTWGGSGGGVSTTYPIPSYQQSMNMGALGGSATMRNIPDVALTAAVQMYVIYNNGQATAVGGTSAAAPLWAGFVALANQQAIAQGKPSVGFLNPAIYMLGKGSNYGAGMHDIVSGSNGYSAIPGFDLATGWGTPKGQALIDDLSGASAAPSFGLSSSASSSSVQAGSNTTVTIQITKQTGFTGTVTLSVSGLPSGVTGSFGAINSSGASILTLTAASGTASGASSLTIQGVSGTLTSTVGLNLQVTGVPSYTLKTSAAAVSIVQAGAGSATITVVPVNGFTGTVNLVVSGLPSGVTASFSPATAGASTLTLVASATAAASTTNLAVTGTSGSLTATTAIALTVVPQALFSLTSSVSTVSVLQGATGAATITVTPKSGFTGKVALTTSALPTGLTASFNPSTTATTSIVTFTATSAAVAGTTTVTVMGTVGTASTSVALSLTVKGASGFSLAATPASLTMTQGTSGISTIAVTPLNGFTGTATLSATGLPSGVTAAFSPATTNASAKLTLTGSASATIGSATVTITGTSGASSATTTIALTMAAPSFTLSSSTPSLNVISGGTGSSTITVAKQGAFTGTVALTATGLPTGVTVSFSPASTTATSTLTFTAASTAVATTSQVTVKGTSGALTETVVIALTVAPPPDFAVALSPSSLSLLSGGKGSSAISITPINGFTGTVTLSSAGLPAGVTASFSVNSGVVLGVFTAGSSAVASTWKVTLTATSGSLIRTAVLNLTVVAPIAGTSPVDLSPSYNVSASAIDYVPFTDGGLDALGRSYSGALLGSSVNYGGTIFSLGPMGLSSAVTGKTVTLPAAKFTTLKLLATGLNGNQSGQTFTVKYSDGTTTVFMQSMSDWYTPQNYTGESSALTMNYRDNSTGTRDGRNFYLYSYTFGLNSGKVVSSITLPANRNVVVLAMTLTGSSTSAAIAPVDLSKAFNGVGIYSDGKSFTGGLDGVGWAYSGTLLGVTQTINGVPFQVGAANAQNVVSGSTGAITLPAGKYSAVQVLATAVNGALSSQPFKVTYSDGTSMTFNQSLSDWFKPSGFSGEVAALTMPYRNAASGVKDNRTFLLYEYTFNLDNAKTVSSIVLPGNNNVKVFAITMKP
jgi:hypothetical protein